MKFFFKNKVFFCLIKEKSVFSGKHYMCPVNQRPFFILDVILI